jgi:hypothetical protein
VGARVPTALVHSGAAPPVCARHGAPGSAQKRTTFVSQPPGWSYVLLLVGVVAFFIVTLVIRKTAVAPAWPYCDHVLDREARLRKNAS